MILVFFSKNINILVHTFGSLLALKPRDDAAITHWGTAEVFYELRQVKLNHLTESYQVIGTFIYKYEDVINM